jgi:hypothetical protein
MSVLIEKPASLRALWLGAGELRCWELELESDDEDAAQQPAGQDAA